MAIFPYKVFGAKKMTFEILNKDEIIKIEILKPAEKSLTTFCFNY